MDTTGGLVSVRSAIPLDQSLSLASGHEVLILSIAHRN